MKTGTRLSLRGCLSMLALLAGGALAGPATAAAPPPVVSAPQFVVQPEADQTPTEIERGYFWLAPAAGQVRRLRLIVQNRGQGVLALRLYPVDGVQGAGGGVDYSTRRLALRGVGTWIRVTPATVRLAPGQAVRVSVRVALPRHVTGERVGGVAIEDMRTQSQGRGSHLLIDVHYRQVVAIVVAAPGAGPPLAHIVAVALAARTPGALATLSVRNAGQVMVRGHGTITISSGRAGAGALPFTLDTILPGAVSHITVPLPAVHLQPGAYQVRVHVASQTGALLAEWRGSVTLPAPLASVTTPLQDIFLKPVQALTPATHGSPLLWAGLGLLVLALGAALGIGLGRQAGKGRGPAPTA